MGERSEVISHLFDPIFYDKNEIKAHLKVQLMDEVTILVRMTHERGWSHFPENGARAESFRREIGKHSFSPFFLREK